MPESSFPTLHLPPPGLRWGGAFLLVATLLLALPPGARARTVLHLPLDPCRSVLGRCLKTRPGTPERGFSSRPVPSSARPGGRVLTVTIPASTVLRRFSPHALHLGGIVTPRGLLLALADRLGLPGSAARGWSQRTVLLVDGKRWRPGGLFGYTKPVLTRGWIRRIDVVEEPPTDPPPAAGATQGRTKAVAPPPREDPSVVDVLLRNLRVSGEASIAAGVSGGSGPYSGGNAEDYNLLLDVHDRRGDALILDFDYERSTIPFFPYGYGDGYGYLPPP